MSVFGRMDDSTSRLAAGRITDAIARSARFLSVVRVDRDSKGSWVLKSNELDLR